MGFISGSIFSFLTYISLMATLWANASQSFPQMECRPWGQIFAPFSLERHQFIGRPGFGFLYFQDCLTTVKDSREGFVCQFLGHMQFGIFHSQSLRLIAALRPQEQSFHECRKLTKRANASQICIPNFDGEAYSHGAFRSPSFMGQGTYQDLAQCQEVLSQATDHFQCYFDGEGEVYMGHLPTGQKVGLAFEGMPECLLANNHTKDEFTCAPYKNGFSIYQNTRRTPGSFFLELDSCIQAIMDS